MVVGEISGGIWYVGMLARNVRSSSPLKSLLRCTDVFVDFSIAYF